MAGATSAGRCITHSSLSLFELSLVDTRHLALPRNPFFDESVQESQKGTIFLVFRVMIAYYKTIRLGGAARSDARRCGSPKGKRRQGGGDFPAREQNTFLCDVTRAATCEAYA